MSDPIPTTPPDVLAGMLANTLDEAMSRVHNSHRALKPWDFAWRGCRTSTLCQEAAQLYESPEVQLAIVVAKEARGE